MITLQCYAQRLIILASLILILIQPQLISAAGCGCHDEPSHLDKGEALRFKLAAIGSVLFADGLGISIPILGRRFQILRPENDMFFMIKAFAAGVILATGFIHILPDAFRSLESPCLGKKPWDKFPFSSFIAMMSAIGTLMVDTVATCYYKNTHFNKRVDAEGQEKGDEEDKHTGHVHIHTHATHGHAHGGPVSSEETRGVVGASPTAHNITSFGIGDRGAFSDHRDFVRGLTEPHTIKPLLFALSFHQFFEGMGLGGCIFQAKFESLTTAIMTLFFSLTTPVGIGVGIGISSVYKENSHIALIVEGVFNTASAGILIYMALVDLLAAVFMNSRMESSVRLQLGSYASLLLGAGSMSFLAEWA